MVYSLDELDGCFPLNTIVPGLEHFKPPPGDFTADGEWEHLYDVFALSRGCHRAGSLRLRRSAHGDNETRLQSTYDKVSPGGFRHVLNADMVCGTDSLATPVRWSWRYTTRDAKGQVVPGTAFEKRARCDGETVTVSDKLAARTFKLTQSPVLSWALFEAVQRLPRESFDPLRFTLIDEFDLPKPNQSIRYRNRLTVRLGGKRVQREQWRRLEKGRVRRTRWEREGGTDTVLHSYTHTGDGILPWVYWVDDSGRLLFARAGLKAFIMKEAKGSPDGKS